MVHYLGSIKAVASKQKMPVGLQASADTLVTFTDTSEINVGYKMTESESTKIPSRI